MSTEIYLQHLRNEYISMGQSYLEAVKIGRSKSELRQISWSIKSVLTEIKAIEQDLRRKTA
jgi:hypothetical protein